MTAFGKDDPETTPLPAPLPGLGSSAMDQSDTTPLPAPLPGLSVSGSDHEQPGDRAAARVSDRVPTIRGTPAVPAVAAALERLADKAPAPSTRTAPMRTALSTTLPPAPSAATTKMAPPAQPVQPSGKKLWLFIGGFGAVAIAAIVMVVLLPTKPTLPQVEIEPGVGRTSPPPTSPRLVQTPVPVHVTPVGPEADKPGAGTAPAAPGQTAPGKPDSDPAGATGSPAGAANPASGGAAANDGDDDPDESDSGTTSKPGKPSREEHRAAAKAARAAARAAAKAAAKTAEPETPPPSQAPLKTLTQDVLRQNMLRAESRFKACAKEAWGSYVTISILVDNSGSVQKAELIGPLGTSATGRCISEQIRKQHFPPFTEGSTKQFVWSYQIPAAN